MMLSATLAGIGFGSAGVHIPHACAYPIAGLKHEYRPAGYPDDHGFVPHGLSVIVTSPAAFRFTYEAAPERHEHVAALLGVRGDGARRAAERAAVAHARRRRAGEHRARSATARTTSRRSSRARRSRRACWRSHRASRRTTTSPPSSARRSSPGSGRVLSESSSERASCITPVTWS